MSCWRRTTVLRIPALYLGFEYLREWNQFLREHDEQLDWDPGWFGPALCENSPEWYSGLDDFLHDPDRRLDAHDPGVRSICRVPSWIIIWRKYCLCLRMRTVITRMTSPGR